MLAAQRRLEGRAVSKASEVSVEVGCRVLSGIARYSNSSSSSSSAPSLPFSSINTPIDPPPPPPSSSLKIASATQPHPPSSSLLPAPHSQTPFVLPLPTRPSPTDDLSTVLVQTRQVWEEDRARSGEDRRDRSALRCGLEGEEGVRALVGESGAVTARRMGAVEALASSGEGLAWGGVRGAMRVMGRVRPVGEASGVEAGV
jgi:hypothetical protein